jgi:hypothetical protein
MSCVQVFSNVYMSCVQVFSNVYMRCVQVFLNIYMNGVQVFSNVYMRCVQVFFCVCALFSLLSAAPAPEPQVAIGAAAVLAAAGVKAAIIAGPVSTVFTCAILVNLIF